MPPYLIFKPFIEVMKKLLLTLVIFLFVSQFSFAQWTTNGSVTSTTNAIGIGTTTPVTRLEIDATSVAGGPSNALFLLNPSNTLGAGAAIIFGGPSNIYSSGSIRGSLYNASAGGTGKLILGSRNSGVNNDELTLSGGYVGIGTDAPQDKLHVYGGNIRITGAGVSGAASGGGVTIYDSDNITRRGFLGDGSAGNTDIYLQADAGGALNFGSNGAASRMFINTAGNVGIGTISPDQKLTVNGTIHSKSVLVDTSVPVPDYVFKSDYNLVSLSEIKNYTDKNHHLPGVPAAAEMEKNGISLGDMSMTLLKKVEELTLYLVEKDKTEQELKLINEKQSAALKLQQSQINELKKSLNHLVHKIATSTKK
jgi:hypothetical protein